MADLASSAAICSADKREAVDPSILDRTDEAGVVTRGPLMTKPHQHQAVRAESLRISYRVVRSTSGHFCKS